MKHFALNINREELKLGREIPALLKLRLKKIFSRDKKTGGKILVVDTCIVGDFLATLPALRTFIAASGQSVDMLVSPPLKPLAEAIRGVDRVFTAKSVYGRPMERSGNTEQLSGSYGLVLVLRISGDAFAMLETIKYSSLRTYDIPYFKYFLHLLKSILLKKEVKQWREINYEMIGMKEPEKSPGFEDIFKFAQEDYGRIAALPELAGNVRKVMIHTGSGWKIKLWEDKKWAELLRRINSLGEFRFIFIGSGEFERRSLERIRQDLDFEVYSLIDRTELRESLLAMRLCDYFIGIDSGPRNMAHLADLRSITLLGPAPNNFKPFNKEDIVINKFDCRCKSLCYLHKESALQKLTPQEVFEAFMKLSRSAPKAMDRPRDPAMQTDPAKPLNNYGY